MWKKTILVMAMEVLYLAFRARAALEAGMWAALLLLGTAYYTTSAASPADMSHGQFSSSGACGPGPAVRPVHGVLAGRGAVVMRSRPRCASACLREEMCARFAYNSTTGACTLEDATVAGVGDEATANDHTVYYERNTCTTNFKTRDALDYIYPLPLLEDEFVLTFGVRAARDALINWSTDGTSSNIKYDLAIGMSENGFTAVRRAYDGEVLVKPETPSLLSANETRYFWLKYRRGEFWLGRSGKEAFLQYADSDPLPLPDAVPRLPHLGFSSWYTDAVWQVDNWCP